MSVVQEFSGVKHEVVLRDVYREAMGDTTPGTAVKQASVLNTLELFVQDDWAREGRCGPAAAAAARAGSLRRRSGTDAAPARACGGCSGMRSVTAGARASAVPPGEALLLRGDSTVTPHTM
eukprot:gene359-22909_t